MRIGSASVRISLLHAVFLTILLSPRGVPAQVRIDADGEPLPKGVLFRLGTVRLRHWVAGGIRFTPDGKRLFSVGATKECREWDIDSGKLLRSLPKDSFPLAFSGDNRLYVTSTDDDLRVYKWPEGKLLHAFPIKEAENIRFDPDNKTLVALTSDHWVHLWDLTTGKKLSKKKFLLAESVYMGDPSSRLSPDGRTLAGILKSEYSRDARTNTLRLWNVATGEEASPSLPVSGTFLNCEWSPDGSRLYEVSNDGVESWDLKSGRKIPLRKAGPVDKKITSEFVKVTPDGQSLLLGIHSHLMCFDLAAGKSRWSRRVAPYVRGPGMKSSSILSFSFHPASKTVAVGCSCGYIALLDWTTGADVGFSSQHPGCFKEPIVFSKDGTYLLVTDAITGRFLLHDARTMKQLCRFDERTLLASSPDRKRLAEAIADGPTEAAPRFLVLKDPVTGKEEWKIPAAPSRVWFSGDGQSVMYEVANDRRVHRVEAGTGKEQPAIPLPEKLEKDASVKDISSDGKLAAIGVKRESSRADDSAGQELQVWEIDGKQRWSWQVPEKWVEWRVRFLPDNKQLIVEGSEMIAAKRVVIFDVATGNKLHELSGSSESSNKEAFSADGKLAAYATEAADGVRIEVRDIAQRKVINKFHRPTSYLSDLKFAPDNRTLALTFSDCTIWMWDSLAEAGK